METLKDLKVPFIFVIGQAREEIKEIVRLGIKGTVGMSTAWIPQQVVLQHPAVGWFLTHGGVGSFHESVMAQVPMSELARSDLR